MFGGVVQSFGRSLGLKLSLVAAICSLSGDRLNFKRLFSVDIASSRKILLLSLVVEDIREIVENNNEERPVCRRIISWTTQCLAFPRKIFRSFILRGRVGLARIGTLLQDNHSMPTMPEHVCRAQGPGDR